MAELEASEPGPFCKLLPVAACQAVIDAGARAAAPTQPEAATDMAQAILGVYRKDDVNDPQVYVRALAGLLGSYPFAVSRKVAHPYEGLPSRLKFLPSIAEVREALDAEDRRQRGLVALARWMIQEREKRAADARALTASPTLKGEQAQAIIEKLWPKKVIP